MGEWVHSKISEEEFALFQPSLDELRLQSKRFVDKIDSKDSFNSFLTFYSVFSPPDRECWKTLKEKGNDLMEKFDDADLISYITNLSRN